jgi:thioredoxin reductase (NADPH)
LDNRDVAIIGAGPAGIAAAIQLKRFDIDPTVFEQDEVGGLLRNAYLVENYPGFPEGIPGMDLVNLMRQHLDRNKIDVRYERVVTLDYREDCFLLRTAAGEAACSVVVVASGTEPKKIARLAIPDDIMDRVFYEIHAIGDVRYKNIAVIGAGDAAFDYALNLARQNEVTIISRGGIAKCNARLWEKAANSLHISHLRNVEVQKVIGRAGRLLVSCSHLDRSEVTAVAVDYLVIAVGREPATHFFTTGLAKQSAYLTLSHRLHMVGDVRNGLYRQASISVGNGIEAAMYIAEHLGA